MGIAGFTVAAAVAGAIIGCLSVRSLRSLEYRYDDEVAAPPPARVGWVVPVAILAAAILAARLLPDHPWTLLLLAPLTAAGPWLAAVDLDVHRLPDRVLGPVAAASLVAVIVVAVVTHRVSLLVLAGIGLVLAGGCYFLLHLFGGGALAFGDVKLAAVLGLTIGPLGLGVLWWALLLSSLLCLAWFAVTHRSKPSISRVAFGPWMLLGSLVAVAALAR